MSANLERERALVSLQMTEAPEKLLLESVYRGQVAQVSFDFRIYQKGSGLTGIFSDPIIQELTIIKRGWWDPFSEQFKIEESKGEGWSSPRPEEFLQNFLSASDIPFDGIYPEEGNYLLARIGLKQVKLQVPFNLLDPFLQETRLQTPWVKWDLNFGRENR